MVRVEEKNNFGGYLLEFFIFSLNFQGVSKNQKGVNEENSSKFQKYFFHFLKKIKLAKITKIKQIEK